jgi:DNA primase large subunit
MSITVADMVKYPFLPQARKHVAKTELEFQTIVELPNIRQRAKDRIYDSMAIDSNSLSKPVKNEEVEIASYPLALLYLVGVGDKKLVERFALFEAEKIKSFLREEKRSDVIIEIARSFGWEIKTEDTLRFIHFAKYLSCTSKGRLSHDPKWKLVNRSIKKGWVMVSPFELARLLQEEVKKKIEDSTTEELGVVPQEIQSDIEELKEEYFKRKSHFEPANLEIKAQESEYPPCIKAILKRSKEGQHLSHTERFTMVTYLLRQGNSIDSVVALFSNIADFNEKKTRYQVENLAGNTGGRTEQYLTYNCSTLQTHGVCPRPEDRICDIIRNPLTYHIIKQNRS